jgi:cation diffusion facilitator CzcD-associated flavoprotein CzcO
MPRAAIIGAGPIGLEAALAAGEHGFDVRVYERSATVGGHVRRWGHVSLFTPWDMNVSPRMAVALGDCAPTGAHLPTGAQLVDELLEPVAQTKSLLGRVQTSTTVVHVAREGLLKNEEVASPERARRAFRLLVAGPDGEQRLEQADIVIDATGTYGNPNRLGGGGIDAVNERAFEARITRFLVPARQFAGTRVLLTGSGHSAQTAARDLAEIAANAPGTRVLWSLRREPDGFGSLPGDPLPERAALNQTAQRLAAGASSAVTVLAGGAIDALHVGLGDRIRVTFSNAEAPRVDVDHVLALNGGQPDASLYRQLQVHECYASLGPMNLAAALAGVGGGDCLGQAPHGPDTLRNPEPGFFILGAKSYGRNSNFLLRIGWQQVDDVFGALT